MRTSSPMRVSEFALSVVESPDLAVKLSPPAVQLVDTGEALAVPAWPGRDGDLVIRPARQARVPKMGGWRDPRLRVRILHGMANHELQAVELYARALVLFVDAAAELRRDLLRVLLEEQRHTLSYIRALERLGGRFGNHPVSGYFWRKVGLMSTPLSFVCAMSLTFENANLDHTLESYRIARQAADADASRMFLDIHRDEIEHVRFGWRWLRRLKPENTSMWDAFTAHLAPPLHPGRASGQTFYPEPRRGAGLDEAFIAALEQAHRAKLESRPDA